jgi:hypothetical protein
LPTLPPILIVAVLVKLFVKLDVVPPIPFTNVWIELPERQIISSTIKRNTGPTKLTLRGTDLSITNSGDRL